MSFEQRKVGDIASVTTGLVVKRKQAELPEDIIEKYQMLTLKSFDQDRWLNTAELEMFSANEILDNKYLTQEGDVIFRLSHPNTAIMIDKAHVGYLISSLFAVIRLKTNLLIPDYLNIYLNSDQMKRFYAKGAIGSTIQIIKTSMLKDVLVRFPSLEQQQKLVEVNRLIAKERELLLQLVAEKAKYHNEIINKLI
ncbi:MAG: restriction endonuclease subunit S [Carboxydocellales bacterium]